VPSGMQLRYRLKEKYNILFKRKINNLDLMKTRLEKIVV
jgi:hypothetical protein